MRLNVDAQVGWSADFYLRSPLYEPLHEIASQFDGFDSWPSLDTYQQLLDAHAPIRLLSGKELRIVAQTGKPHCFADHYAPRIYLSGELQTRSENWHDFFQYLTWFIFPRAKAQINAMHLPYAKPRLEGSGDPGRRTPLENMLSLFDEGGAVIAASDPSLLQLIREFRWKELFWQRRTELANKLHCITFGHALYEKGLTPYVGMTSNTILLEVEPHYFGLSLAEKIKQIDAQLVTLLREEKLYTKPKDLHPFPILGMPGWHEANHIETFYDNRFYFRPGRRNQG